MFVVQVEHTWQWLLLQCSGPDPRCPDPIALRIRRHTIEWYSIIQHDTARIRHHSGSEGTIKWQSIIQTLEDMISILQQICSGHGTGRPVKMRFSCHPEERYKASSPRKGAHNLLITPSHRSDVLNLPVIHLRSSVHLAFTGFSLSYTTTSASNHLADYPGSPPFSSQPQDGL